jgi:hypothetical protein
MLSDCQLIGDSLFGEQAAVVSFSMDDGSKHAQPSVVKPVIKNML